METLQLHSGSRGVKDSTHSDDATAIGTQHSNITADAVAAPNTAVDAIDETETIVRAPNNANDKETLRSRRLLKRKKTAQKESVNIETVATSLFSTEPAQLELFDDIELEIEVNRIQVALEPGFAEQFKDTEIAAVEEEISRLEEELLKNRRAVESLTGSKISASPSRRRKRVLDVKGVPSSEQSGSLRKEKIKKETSDYQLSKKGGENITPRNAENVFQDKQQAKVPSEYIPTSHNTDPNVIGEAKSESQTKEEIQTQSHISSVVDTPSTYAENNKLICELREVMKNYDLSQAEVCRYSNFSGGQAALSIWLSGKHVSKEEMKKHQIRTFIDNVSTGVISIPPQLIGLGDKRLRRRAQAENPSTSSRS